MKKLVALFVISICLQISNFGQEVENSLDLYPVFVKGKYGYINAKGETATYTYTADGYLLNVDGPLPGV